MGQQIRYADIELPEPDVPEYRDWTPARLARDDVSHVDYLAPRTVYADDAFVIGIHSLIGNVFASTLDYLGVGYRNYDELLGLGDAVLGRGSFDAARVRETVRDSTYEAVGEYEGYDLFERSRGGGAAVVAVRDGTVVYSRAERTREAIETVVDTVAGRRERLHERDDGFGTLSRDLGATPAMSFWRGHGGMAADLAEERDPRWSVNCSMRDDEYVYEVNHTRFEGEVDVSEQQAKAHLEDDNDWIRAHAVDVTVDGALVEVVVRWTREEALEWTDGQVRSPPHITWETAIGDDGDTVRIAHLAGDSVDADELTITYGDRGADDQPEPQFADRFETVEPGDELTVDVGDRPDGSSLWILHGPNESQSAILETRVLE